MKDEFKFLLSFLVALVAGTSGLYLELYWSRFNVSPFLFISFSDILPLASPFLKLAASLCLGVGIGILIFPPGFKPHSNGIKAMRIVLALIVVLFLGCLAVFFYAPQHGFWGVGTLLAAATGFAANIVKELIRLPSWALFFTSSFSRLVAAVAVVYLPIAAMWSADLNARKIITRSEFQYVLAVDLKENVGLPAGCKLPIIGRLGSAFVLDAPDLKEKLFVQFDGFRVFRVGNFKSTNAK